MSRVPSLSRTRSIALIGVLTLVAAIALASGREAGAPAQERAAAPGSSGTVTLTEGSMIQLAVSPDHRTILMNLLGTFWSLPADGGKAKKLTGLFADPAYPNWSPRGDEIAFQSYRSRRYHIWTMHPDGSQLRQLTHGGFDDREPVYSPDGRQIAFSSDRGGSGAYDVWVLDLARGRLRQLTHVAANESAYQPTWSPDGQSIAYVQSTPMGQSIRQVDASGGGDARVLFSYTDATIFSPRWSPDGRSLAYELLRSSDNSTTLMVDDRAVTSGEDVFTFPVSWLDDDTLLYAADGRIRRRDVSTGRRQDVPFSATVDFQRAAYPRKRHDFASRQPQPVKGIANPVLSPDGSTVAFVALNRLWT